MADALSRLDADCIINVSDQPSAYELASAYVAATDTTQYQSPLSGECFATYQK